MSGLVKRKFFHRYIGNGTPGSAATETYTIPNGVSILYIECIGSGGGGGGGQSSRSDGIPGGGGGGCCGYNGDGGKGARGEVRIFSW